MLSRRRPAVSIGLGLLVLLAGSTHAWAGTAGDDPSPVDPGIVDVVQVSGLLDPVMADFIGDALADADRAGSLAVVLQMDSSDAVVDDDDFVELAEQVRSSPVPVVVWVGPSGSRVTGASAQLAGVADRIGIAPGARLGDTGEPLVTAERWDATLAARLETDALNWEQVIDAGIVDCEQLAVDELGRELTSEDQRLRCAAPTVGDFVVDLDELGFQTREIRQADEIRLEPVTQVRFTGLPLTGQLMHTVASPPIAYLLFIIGAGLLLFELYTAGIGIAGAVGAICLILGCYGLATLPTNTWALVVLVLSFVAFGIDVQAGIPRFWTAVGSVLFIVATLGLYTDGVSMSWLTIAVGIVGMLLSMISGMPAMVRTRFSTPTIGREWMVGELGVAVGDVAPDGMVLIRDAKWRARTNRATPIHVGDAVRVVAIDGLLLEVEPKDGGARDYRERGPRNPEREVDGD